MGSKWMIIEDSPSELLKDLGKGDLQSVWLEATEAETKGMCYVAKGGTQSGSQERAEEGGDSSTSLEKNVSRPLHFFLPFFLEAV